MIPAFSPFSMHACRKDTNIYILRRDYEKGISEGRKAVELEPNGADCQAWLGMGLLFADRSAEAIQVLKKAIRLNPIAPGWYLHNLAGACRNLGQYDEAIAWAEKAVKRHPKSVISHVILATCYSYAGRMEDARAEAAEVLRLNPNFSVERFEKTSPTKNPIRKKRFIEALRKAGLK